MFTIGKDDPMIGGTLYIESVRIFIGSKQIVTTSDKAKALHFDSIVDAERYALDNNIKLFDATNPQDNTCESYTIFC